MQGVHVGIDLGATRIKAAVINNSGTVIERVYQPTHEGPEGTWKTAVREITDRIRSKSAQNVNRIGIAAPGLPNAAHTGIAVMPGRLQGLENFLWKDFLRVQTFVVNDAVAALMAEARFGAAKGKKNVVMITLGTGVGGAILIDGKPYQGAYHKAGHIGHMVINDEGDPGVTGTPGSLEDSIGNETVKKRSQGRFSSTEELLDACKGGDTLAKEVWLTSVRKLAVGIASLTNILSPEAIVLGGGIAEAGSSLFDPLEEYLGLYEWRPLGPGVKIVKAALGDLAGAIGAACFAEAYCP